MVSGAQVESLRYGQGGNGESWDDKSLLDFWP